MLPLSKETYTKLLGLNSAGQYTGTQYNIYNNSNIKAVFINQISNNNIADLIFSKANPYTYLRSLTSSPTKFSLQSNLGFNFTAVTPDHNYDTPFANQLKITGKITINAKTFTPDGTTDEFIFLVDESINEVVSYVKLTSDTSNTILNNITEIAFTNDIVNTSNLYAESQLTLSAGVEDFIQGNISLSSLKVCILKDVVDDDYRSTYGQILGTTTIQELSDVVGGNRIKVISQNHSLSGLGIRRYTNTTTNFSMSLTAEETVIESSPATQGYNPPFRALLYDIKTQKPLVLFSESLGIEGQDNIFVKANATGATSNILNLEP